MKTISHNQSTKYNESSSKNLGYPITQIYCRYMNSRQNLPIRKKWRISENTHRYINTDKIIKLSYTFFGSCQIYRQCLVIYCSNQRSFHANTNVPVNITHVIHRIASTKPSFIKNLFKSPKILTSRVHSSDHRQYKIVKVQ